MWRRTRRLIIHRPKLILFPFRMIYLRFSETRSSSRNSLPTGTTRESGELHTWTRQQLFLLTECVCVGGGRSQASTGPQAKQEGLREEVEEAWRKLENIKVQLFSFVRFWLPGQRVLTLRCLRRTSILPICTTSLPKRTTTPTTSFA